EVGLHRARWHMVSVGAADDWMGAIRGAAPDTEIQLADGVYDMGSAYSIDIATADVTLRGASGDRAAVVIRGGGVNGAPGEAIKFLNRNITIADLTIRDIASHAISLKSDA